MDVVWQWNAPFRRTIQPSPPPSLLSVGSIETTVSFWIHHVLAGHSIRSHGFHHGRLGESNEMECLYMTGGCNGNKI